MRKRWWREGRKGDRKEKGSKEKEKLGKGGRRAKNEGRKVEGREERKESPVWGGQRRHLSSRGAPRESMPNSELLAPYVFSDVQVWVSA